MVTGYEDHSILRRYYGIDKKYVEYSGERDNSLESQNLRRRHFLQEKLPVMEFKTPGLPDTGRRIISRQA